MAPLVLGGAGCEHGVDGSGVVHAPEEVQRLFSADNPGQVAVRVDWPGRGAGRTEVVGYLCAPGTGPASLQFTDFDFDCAHDAVLTVHAWAAPVAAPIPVERCGQLAHSGGAEAPTLRENAVAYASGQVPVAISDSLGKCDDGSFHFELTLAPGGPADTR